MQVVIWDTLALEPFFISSQSPKQLLAALEPSIRAKDGLWQSHGVYVRDNYAVWQAAQLDGYEACVAAQMWGLMNPSRSREASAWAFQQFRAEEVLKKVEGWVKEWGELFEALPEKLEVFVVPGDPANRGLMLRSGGLSMGGLRGCITATLWPSQGNLERLKPVLARAFLLALRQSLHPAQTLGDYLVQEGLAGVFAGQVQFDPAPWLLPFAPPRDWPQELARVARLHGYERYQDLPSNLYGTILRGEYPGLRARPLQADELEQALSLLPQALPTTDTNAIAAYLYGDEAVQSQGHPGVGMVSLGGLEVAYWMIQNYFARNPHQLAWAIARPSGEIIWEAGYLT